jgi:hypothetical protein
MSDGIVEFVKLTQSQIMQLYDRCIELTAAVQELLKLLTLHDDMLSDEEHAVLKRARRILAKEITE